MTFGTQINGGAAAADTEPSAFLGNVQPVPAVEKARAEFERAQKVEERFNKEFDGLDFTNRQAALCPWSSRLCFDRVRL